jgi:hypothetical protein
MNFSRHDRAAEAEREPHHSDSGVMGETLGCHVASRAAGAQVSSLPRSVSQ